MNLRLLLCGLLLTGCATAPTPSASGISAAIAGTEPVVWPDEGPRRWAPRPTESPITANDLRTRLYAIADDSMRGRRVGEEGNLRATQYIADEFRRLGLEPAGDNGTWFQTLPFGRLAYEARDVRLHVGGRAATPGGDWIPLVPSVPNRVAGESNVRGVATIFAGRWGDTAVSLDPAALRGKVAVFAGPARPASTGGGRAGGAFNPTTVRDLRAERAGAVAVLVASLDSVPANIRTAALAARNAMRPDSMPGLPMASITTTLAEQILGRPLATVMVGQSGASIDAAWRYGFTPTPYPARNVIAVLPGSDPKRATQYVLVGAHNDHVGTLATPVDHDSVRAFNRIMRPQGANDAVRVPTAAQQRQIDSLLSRARSIRPPRRDSVMNGADDDGSGTAVLLEIAERFAIERPARSIVFISHQGEEAGLLGSRWFVDHPTIPRDSIVAAHNMDMIGKGRVSDVRFGGPSSVQTLGSRRLSREFGDIIDSVNAISAEPMAIDRSWDVPANPLNRFCRSDQVNYVRYDIPVTYFSLGYSIDYHMATDEPQYVDYDHSARLGRFIHDVMLAIANRRDRPAIAGPDPAYPSCNR